MHQAMLQKLYSVKWPYEWIFPRTLSQVKEANYFCNKWFGKSIDFQSLNNGARRSHRWFSTKKGVFKSFKFHRKTPLLESLFNKRLQYRCFPLKFAKFLRTSFLKNNCERLCLRHQKCIKEPVYVFLMLCAIWCHLYNLKKVKNTHGGVLILLC